MKMKKNLTSGLLAVAVAALAAAGCGEEKPSSASPDLADDGVVTVTLLAAVPASLPTCTTTLSGTLAFVASPAGLWSCNNSTWTAVSCTTATAGKILYASTSQTVVAACVHAAWVQVQGPTGATGATGTTGASGPRSLIKVTAEPQGTNCLNGGERVDTGVDTSGDGTLQSGEIQQTNYVCNGRGEPSPGVINGRPPVGVARGNQHACAVLGDGTVWCWGASALGQMGKPSSGITCNGVTPCTSVPHPIQVPGVANATAVTAGDDFTCALQSGGTVMCWGSNANGQLGQNNSTTVTTAVTVKGVGGTGTLGSVKAITAGNSHVCALLTSGGVDCWGDNDFGELADGTNGSTGPCTFACRGTPAPVTTASGAALTGVTSVSSGARALHTCAILGTGTPATGPMVCWGYNLSYQLAVQPEGQVGPEFCGSQPCSTRALPVMNMNDALAVAAGESHTCTIRKDHTAVCWGINDAGQLGFDQSVGQDQDVPNVPVSNLTGAISITAGSKQNCAILSGGTTVCWGNSAHGQLGSGFDDPGVNPSPVPIPDLFGVRQVSAAIDGTCALTDRGAYCWGANVYGQDGNGSVGVDSFLPRVVQ